MNNLIESPALIGCIQSGICIPAKNITSTEEDFEDPNEVPEGATTLVFTGNNCYNTPEYTYLNMSRYPYLQELEIGDDCFWYTENFVLDGLRYLKKVTIGSNSFTKHKNEEWGQSNAAPLDNKNRYLRIENCPRLEEVSFNQFSFNDYGGGFTVNSMIILSINQLDLPQLKSLLIGDYIEDSDNFFYSSISVKSRQSVCYSILRFP